MYLYKNLFKSARSTVKSDQLEKYNTQRNFILKNFYIFVRSFSSEGTSRGKIYVHTYILYNYLLLLDRCVGVVGGLFLFGFSIYINMNNEHVRSLWPITCCKCMYPLLTIEIMWNLIKFFIFLRPPSKSDNEILQWIVIKKSEIIINIHSNYIVTMKQLRPPPHSPPIPLKIMFWMYEKGL